MESFVTPIILSYVQKYVNLRPQDAQVSLWEGDAAFQNLDLRLDVLQNELQLPFEFLSGHIHELIIHIPWTKITSEPISVTINTIEFVLKLKDLNNSAPAKPEKPKNNLPVEEVSKGYLNSLVDKIVNNVSITCNNIILKYVEEDIVVSMNIQLLSFCSADDGWKPAYVDVSPTNVVLRKLVHVSDLTICLDKRNSAGQIDVCQEPILYKCSLETRILIRFPASMPKASITNIEVFTRSLELNISSQQFPMVMRLIMLVLSLKTGKLQGKSIESAQLEASDSTEFLNSDSMLSWAWSKVPSLFPLEEDDDENKANLGPILTIGLYIAHFKLTLKSLEIFVDSIVQNSRKIRYNPIVRLCFNGIYSETFSYGSKWFNTKAGISQACIEPLGMFAIRGGVENTILVAGSGSTDTYLQGSFFDSENEAKAELSKKRTVLDLKTHLEEITEDYLSKRTSAIAFDMVHIVEVPDRHAFDPELAKDLEYSNLPETTLIRAFISNLTVKHNSAILGVINVVREMVNSYDYPPYIEDKSDDSPSKLPPPLMDDYDALMVSIPLKTISLTLNRFSFEVHPLAQPQAIQPVKGLSHKKSFCDVGLPFLTLRINRLELQNVAPIYENRLVYTTCQLPDKPKKLLDACYITVEVVAKSIQLYLVDSSDEFILFEIPDVICSFGTILKEQHWADDIEQMRGSCIMRRICIRFSRPQEILLIRLLKTLFAYDRKALWALSKSNARNNLGNESLDRLEVSIPNASANFSKFHYTWTTDGSIDAVKAFVIRGMQYYDENGKAVRVPLFEAPRLTKSADDFIRWKVQLPVSADVQKYALIVLVKIRESTLILDPELETILFYDDTVAMENLNAEVTHQEVETKLSHISVTSERYSKKTIQPDETIHISSDKEDKFETATTDITEMSSNKNFNFNILPNLSNVVLGLEMDQCEIILPREKTNYGPDFSNEHPINIGVDYLLIKLPSIKCKSSNSTTLKFEDDFPVLIDVKTNTNKSGFSWSFEISELSASMNEKEEQKYIIVPIKTSVTIAFEVKTVSKASNFALNLHLDTAPIVCNIYDDQIMFLKNSIFLLSSLSNLLTCADIPQPITVAQQPKALAAFDDDLDIREFLAINSNSELSPDVDSTSANDKSTVSIWLQWTFTKITLNLLTTHNSVKSKLVLDIEDFITSIDQQNIYFKLKTKIGALSVQYFNLNEEQEWIVSDDLKLAVQLQPSENERQDAFLDFTLTVAEVENVLKKWGAKTKTENQSTLSEIVLNLKAIDVQLSVKGIEAVFPLLGLLTLQQDRGFKKQTSKEIQTSTTVHSVADLPLLHFDCKGIVVYIPTDETENDCDVLILKVGHIKIRPNVDNPLTRMPIRPDVYTKAEQLRILSTPGSKIEDRQYELIISNISAVTSTWSEMMLLIKENHSTFYNTNPAVEWNNLDKKPTVKIEEIFKNFVVSIIYAPCIVYKSTLICGQSIELNCVTDLDIDITIDQVLLLGQIFRTVENSKCILSHIEVQMPSKKRSIIYLNKQNSHKGDVCNEKIKPKSSLQITPSTRYGSLIRINRNSRGEKLTSQMPSENINTDSGFASVEKRQEKTLINDNHTIPYDISIVAGVFSFKLHQKIREIDQEGNADRTKLQTLLNITITQPSMLITRKLYEYNVKYSIFNLMVKLGEDGSPGGSEMLFETERGNVNPAGIAPPLLSVTFQNSISKKVNVSCCIGRPIKTHICQGTFYKLCNIKNQLNSIFIENKECVVEKVYKPVVRGTTIRMIRNTLFDTDSICLSLDEFQFECIHKKQYGVKFRINKVILKVDNFEHPESLSGHFKIESLFVQTIKHALLHPLSIKCDIQLKQEQWHKFPVVNCKVETNVAQIDLSPEHILNLTEIQKIMLDTFNECFSGSEIDILNKSESQADVNQGNKLAFAVPKVQRKLKSVHKDEYFQDDLRAGAFQIIEVKGDSIMSLPLPYQMKISLNDRTICWRYPQPRCITKLLLYPILIEHTAPISISCRFEYYNEVLDAFVPYFDFALSETETQSPEMPEAKISAFIWRVVIIQKMLSCPNRLQASDAISTESDENGETGESETIHIDDFFHSDDVEFRSVLHPKSLIGCMRIDSSFEPQKIPILQFVLRVPHLQVNLQNQLTLENFELPPPIQQFSIANDFYRNHTFASIILSNVNLYSLQRKHQRYSANVDLNIGCRVLDYSYLNMLDLLEHTNIKGFISLEERIDCNIVVDVMRFNLGPAMMHTLLTSENLYRQILSKKQSYVSIVTRFVVCNCTQVPFHFGQTTSNELIILRPNECSFYAFRSDHLKQQLTFTFENQSGRESCVLRVENEGTQYLKVGNYVIVATIEKLSSTQLCIFIKGQIELLSMSKEHFEVQYAVNGAKYYLDLGLYGHGSFVGECNKGLKYFIRLKLKEGKGWSGEIPLLSKKVPWLVKVPCSTEQQFISFWVRVIEEDINSCVANTFKPKRLLLLIWPMFVMKSLLPSDIQVTDMKNNNSYTLQGRGAMEELSIAAANDTEHEFYLSKKSFSPDSQDDKVVLTYKHIDRSTFFETENKNISIDVYVKNLKKPKSSNLPYSNHEQLRSMTLQGDVKCIYRNVPSQQYSSTLMLEILPWCLFVNSTGQTIKITNISNDKNTVIENNCLTGLFAVEDAFKIEVSCGIHWMESHPIFVNENSFRRNLSKNKLLLPETGNITFQIHHACIVSRFVLSSKQENSVRVIKLAAAFVIVNFSDITFDIVPFSFEDNQRVSEKHINELLSNSRFKIQKSTSTARSEGIPIATFVDVTERNPQKSVNVSLKHFICVVGNQNVGVTLPLLITKPFNRKCFSIVEENNAIPLSACVIEKDGQYVISIFNDKSPALQMNNFTDLTFFVAGTKSQDNDKSVKVMSELNEKGFEWHQIIRANSTIFYTPPEMYMNFPDAENLQCNLSLALCLSSNQSATGSKQNIRWSKPLTIESSRETLLNIPLHGDVKILVCKKHKTVKVSVFYITQGMEFSVKELRTRLSDQDKTLAISEFKRQDSLGNLRKTNQLQMDYPKSSNILDISCNICNAQETPNRMPNINVFLKETSVSVFFDSKSEAYVKHDMLSIHLDDVAARFDSEQRSMSLIVSNVQLDNQSYASGNYDFPVIVCAENEYTKDASLPSTFALQEYIARMKSPLLQLRVFFYKEELDVERIYCKINAIRAYIEDTYVNDLLDHLIDCDPSNAVYIYEDPPDGRTITPGYVSIPDCVVNAALHLSGTLQLSSVKIEPISLMLSVHTCVRLYIALDHSPLYFSSYERQNILTLPLKFGHAVGMHYLSGAIFGAGWVVGSLEILGSPGGLARSLSTGLKDFVSMPVQGLFRGPWGFLAGITQGSASLLRNITAGTVNSVTKLAASVARNLDRLTLDEEHFQRTEALRRSRPQGVTEGLTQGLTGLGISLLGALGGLARHPLEAKSSVQVVTGVAKGIVGAFAKPISGAAELVALTGQGMLHTVGFNTMPQQRNLTSNKNVIACPADCKLPWKHLPHYSMILINQLLFYHDATLVGTDQLKRVIIALTPVAFIIVEYDKDFPAEIIPIERIEIFIDAADKTLVEIGVLHSDDYDEEEDSVFFNTRMMSFLRDSSDNLPTTSVRPLDERLMKSNNIERKYKMKRTFYINESIALHLACYLNVIKNSGDFLKFSVYH